MTSEKNYTIAFLTNQLDNAYQEELWSGLRNAGIEAGVKLIAISGRPLASPYDFQATDNIIFDFVPELHVDGLIVAAGLLGCYCGKEVLEQHIKDIAKDVPVVTIAMKLGPWPAILNENCRAIKTAIYHLVNDHACSSVAFLAGPATNPESVQREEAVRSALDELGCPLNPDLIETGNFIYTDGKKAARRLLQKGIPFDALFAANDEMAMGFIDVCKEMGVAVPEKIRVAGLDNTQNGRYSSPSLSSIDTMVPLQGAEALNVLLSIIEGGKRNDSFVHSSFIKRESCGCTLSGFSFSRHGDEIHDQIPRMLITAGNKVINERLDLTHSPAWKKHGNLFLSNFAKSISEELDKEKVDSSLKVLQTFLDTTEEESLNQIVQVLLSAFQSKLVSLPESKANLLKIWTFR